MKLQDLLAFDDIVIQCHNDPDADALASGYGVYAYLRQQGRRARLIYGGERPIQKSNLRLMVQTLHIPVEHVQTLAAPALLVTVDCQYGQRNVQRFDAQTVAVIDHHQVFDPQQLPPLRRVHSDYGSCSTLLWQMLTEADYDLNADPELSTALYYGLYMDTNRLQEIFHPMDRDMRDSLHVLQGLVLRYQNANLSLAELKIAGQALAAYDYHTDQRFAIVGTAPCDPNILGLISDMLLEVDAIDTCVAYCPVASGVKLSVRSTIKEVHANELAAFLCQGLGNGGGHRTKAGGFLENDHLQAELTRRFANPAQRNVHQLLVARMQDYFASCEVLDATATSLDTAQWPRYVKRRVAVGYVEPARHFGAGSALLVRTRAGEFELRAREDMCLMISVDQEVYPISRERLKVNYTLLDDPCDMQGEYPPRARNVQTGEVRLLLPLAKACVEKGHSAVYARQLTRATKVFTLWDNENYVLGAPGDWLVARQADPRDIYIVKQNVFALVYQQQD